MFLLTHVGSDTLLIQAHSTHAIPARPKLRLDVLSDDENLGLLVFGFQVMDSGQAEDVNSTIKSPILCAC